MIEKNFVKSKAKPEIHSKALMSPAENDHHNRFLRGFTAHEPAIRAFVRRLVPTRRTRIRPIHSLVNIPFSLAVHKYSPLWFALLIISVFVMVNTCHDWFLRL